MKQNEEEGKIVNQISPKTDMVGAEQAKNH